ncbi:hypothetical protein BKA70DRAFT_1244850 [Coprinopsis sp. MPI-PUGE-AT-0042]|nr:hypothetical protein BKA70DRAFT_1244850 [Coprinopsis sp. MPI-PUGE-AT-0042]
MPKAQKEVPAPTRQSTRKRKPARPHSLLPTRGLAEMSVDTANQALSTIKGQGTKGLGKKIPKRGAKNKALGSRKKKKLSDTEDKQDDNTHIDTASIPSVNMVNPLYNTSAATSPALALRQTNAHSPTSTGSQVIVNPVSPLRNTETGKAGELNGALDDGAALVNTPEDNWIPRGRFGRGLLESLLDLQRKTRHQQEGGSIPDSVSPQVSPSELQPTQIGDSTVSHASSPARPIKSLPARHLVPQVIIKRTSANTKLFQTPFIPASRLPRDQKRSPSFTPANSDLDEPECEDDANSDDEPGTLPPVPEKPFNNFRVATEDELPPASQPVPIQLGRPKLPGMDISPYHVSSSAARIEKRPRDYSATGFEPYFSFYKEDINTFLLIPSTHHVTGWPMYPGSSQALDHDWKVVQAALEEHVHSVKRKHHNLESPLHSQIKRARRTSISNLSSPPSPLPGFPAASLLNGQETFSDSASDYSATQKDRRKQGRHYSLSGTDDEGPGSDTDQVPQSTQPSTRVSHAQHQPEASCMPSNVSAHNDKGKGKAGPSSSATPPCLVLSDDERNLALDSIEALMQIAVDHDTDFPSVFAAVGVDVSRFFPLQGEVSRRPSRPRYDNPFNYFLPYFGVMNENVGRKIPFAEYSAQAAVAYAPYKKMTDAERAPHVQKWISVVVDHAKLSGKKPALLKYHQVNPIKQLERAIADVQAMGQNIRKYGDHIHFTAAVFSTDVVVQQGSVAMSSSGYFLPYIHQLGLRIRPQLNQMISFTQACEHGFITPATTSGLEKPNNEVVILCDGDDDDDDDTEQIEAATMPQHHTVPSPAPPGSSRVLVSRITASTAAATEETTLLADLPHAGNATQAVFPPSNGPILSDNAQAHYDAFKGGQPISFPAGKRWEKDWSRKFFGIAYQDLITADASADSVKHLDSLTLPHALLGKFLHHLYQNTLEVLLVHGATLVWPSQSKRLMPGNPDFIVNKLSREFLHDHYKGMRDGSPTVAFVPWRQEWRNIDPTDPNFSKLPLIQDEHGKALHCVCNVGEWVTALARQQIATQANKSLGGAPPIVKARGMVEGFKAVGAVDRETIRTDDLANGSTFEAVEAQAITKLQRSYHQPDPLDINPAIEASIELATAVQVAIPRTAVVPPLANHTVAEIISHTDVTHETMPVLSQVIATPLILAPGGHHGHEGIPRGLQPTPVTVLASRVLEPHSRYLHTKGGREVDRSRHRQGPEPSFSIAYVNPWKTWKTKTSVFIDTQYHFFGGLRWWVVPMFSHCQSPSQGLNYRRSAIAMHIVLPCPTS